MFQKILTVNKFASYFIPPLKSNKVKSKGNFLNNCSKFVFAGLGRKNKAVAGLFFRSGEDENERKFENLEKDC